MTPEHDMPDFTVGLVDWSRREDPLHDDDAPTTPRAESTTVRQADKLRSDPVMPR